MLELSHTIATLLAIVAAIGTVGSLLLQRVQIAKLAAELQDLKRQRDLQLEKVTLEVQRLRDSTSPIHKPTPAEVDDIVSQHQKQVWGTRLSFPIALTLERAGLLLLAYVLLAVALPAARTPAAIAAFVLLLVTFMVVYHWQGMILVDRRVRRDKERSALERAYAHPADPPSETQ
jgi:hypothetical protein